MAGEIGEEKNMNRLIYLFELDSVIKYDHEKCGVAFTPGVRGLFCEIIKHGNSVAITMNQLTDSQLIKEAISDEIAYTSLLRLFECGGIKLSLYNDIRTASQYMQQAIQKYLNANQDTFLFSNLPVKRDEDQLLCDIQRALQFSDLSLLQERVEDAKDDEKERFKMIYRFVNMILQISVCETSNIPRKDTPKRSFEEFMNLILPMLEQYPFSDHTFDETVKKAVAVLKKRSKKIEVGRNNRSNWLDLEANHVQACLANQIVHICYNYTVEDSIKGVSKHYDERYFEETFRADLISRMELSYAELQAGEKRELPMVSKSQWKMIVRFAEYRSQCVNDEVSGTYLYVEDFAAEKWKWIRFMLLKNMGSFLMAFTYIVIFFAVELGISKMEESFSTPLHNTFVASVISVLLFGILSSLISRILKALNHKQDVPDILESLFSIGIHFCDFWRVLGGKNDSYRLY